MHRLPDCLRISLPVGNTLRCCNHRHSLGSPHSIRRPLQRRGTVQPVYAKTNDGKQRRPKSSLNAKPEGKVNDQNDKGAAAPPPPRVSVNSRMGVKTQIRILREVKKAEATSYRKAPVPQTYRKETKAPEDYRQEKAVAEAKAVELSKNESKNFALSKLYRTAELTTSSKLGLSTASSVAVLPPPVLLVDGYNILHKWERTAALMKSNGYASDGNGDGGGGGRGDDIEIARDILIEALGVYSQTNGVRVIVAFDAMQGSATGIEEQILSTGVTVAYTGNCEADSFIEAQVDFWLQKRHLYVVVATSDVAQKAVVDSKTGPDKKQLVFVVPASGLCKDIEATEKRLEQQLEDIAMQPVSRGILGSAIKFKNKTAFSKMQKMRVALPTASTFPELEKLKQKNNGRDGRGQPKLSGENEE